MRHLLYFIIVSFLVSGCGRKGPLIPPEAMVPAPVSDLAATQKGERFQVSWTIPDRDEGGRPVRDLSHFLLFRREVLPPDQDCEVCPDAYQVLNEVYLDYPRDAVRVGDMLFLSDPGVTTGTTYQFKVVGYLSDGTPSRDSNRFRLTKVAPPPAPRLKAISTPTSVLLHWDGTVVNSSERGTGYNIYRWRIKEPPALAPLNDIPIRATDFEDFRLQRGVAYIYAVRAVGDADGVQVESDPSNEMAGALTEPD